MRLRYSTRSVMAEYGPPTVISVLLLLYSLYLHIYKYWSPLTLPDSVWAERLEFHMSWHPFAIRFIQNYATLALHKLSALPLRESFYSIQYVLELALALLLFRFLRQLGFGRAWSNAGVFMLLASYPILGAHFEPTFSWDDAWSYVFLLATAMAVLSDRWMIACVVLTLGFFAREQIVLAYPVFLLAAWNSRHRVSRSKIALSLALPVTIYGLYRLAIWDDIDPRRWELLLFNFESRERTNDTVVSMIIAFGFMWLTALLGAYRMLKERVHRHRVALAVGGAIFLVFTTAFTLTLAYARETRIFFPPFVTVIPLTIFWARSHWRNSIRGLHPVLWVSGLGMVALSIWVGYRSAIHTFLVSDYSLNSDLRIPLAGINLGLVVAVLGAYLVSGLKRLYVWGESTGRITNRWLSTVSMLLISAPVMYLAIFVAGPLVKGPDLVPVLTQLEHTFDNRVKLDGVYLEEEEGITAAIRFEMTCLAPVERGYKIFVHMYPDIDAERENIDVIPQPPFQYWKPGSTHKVREPLSVESGHYRVVVGIFRGGEGLGTPTKFDIVIK